MYVAFLSKKYEKWIVFNRITKAIQSSWATREEAVITAKGLNKMVWRGNP